MKFEFFTLDFKDGRLPRRRAPQTLCTAPRNDVLQSFQLNLHIRR